MCKLGYISQLAAGFAAVIAALCMNVGTAAAQERGVMGLGPRIGVYAHTGGEPVYGTGAELRYNLSDAVRLAPSFTWLFNEKCTVEGACDFHFMLRTARHWYIYPVAGATFHNLRGRKLGLDVGLGTDYALGRHIDLSAGVRWIVELRGRPNPVVAWAGVTFKFGGRR